MKTISKYMPVLVIGLIFAVFALASPGSAAVDFSALTDLVNATFTILSTFVTNSTTLYSFVILMAGLGLIGIIVYGFMGRLFAKIAIMGK